MFVGILDSRTDDFGRAVHDLQIEGSKTGRELPGIVDEVITMAVMPVMKIIHRIGLLFVIR